MRLHLWMIALLAPAAPCLAATSIAPATVLIPGVALPNQQPDGNSIVIEAPDGEIVFDTGRHPEHAQEILDYARQRGRPIAAIINSHWHLDHIGGNSILRSAFPGIAVYASSGFSSARSTFLADYRASLIKQVAAPSSDSQARLGMQAEIGLIDQGAALGPTEVIEKSAAMKIAGRVLDVHLESHAVTAGDVWVFDPQTRVLMAGDLVTLPAPFFESACPARWQASLAHLAKVRFDVLVPGHGPPMKPAQLSIYRKAFGNLLHCAAGKSNRNACIDGWIADAAQLIDANDVSYARSLIDYYLKDYLRNPSARVRSFCAA